MHALCMCCGNVKGSKARIRARRVRSPALLAAASRQSACATRPTSGAAAALPARADEPSAAVVLLSVHASAACCPYAGRLCGRVQTARVPCCTAASACLGHSLCSAGCAADAATAARLLSSRPAPQPRPTSPQKQLPVRNNEEQRLPKQSDRHTHNRKKTKLTSRSSRPSSTTSLHSTQPTPRGASCEPHRDIHRRFLSPRRGLLGQQAGTRPPARGRTLRAPSLN